MRLFQSLADYRAARKSLAFSTQVGCVPTMGALHAGHASLAARSVRENDITVVTIFVNPTQFGPNEDFNRYPRTLEADMALLQTISDDIWVLAPTAAEVYPFGKETEVGFTIQSMDKVLCGASRPGHFNGVLQVVSLLFNLVQPDRAYFGEKDFQQVSLIRRMAQELHFPVEVIACTLIREADGLAMSSRNIYLNAEERQQALFLYTTLESLRADYEQFATPGEMISFAQMRMNEYPLVRPDYFEIRESADLSLVADLRTAVAPRGFVAAFLGTTRLIDNMLLR